MTTMTLIDRIRAEIARLEQIKRELRDERILLERARDSAVELERRL